MRYRFLRFPGGKSKAVTFSYDDGCKQDLKTIQILDRYGMKGTFNLNSYKMRGSSGLSEAEVKEKVLAKGHEIALHGANHEAAGVVRPIEGIQDVLENRLELEERYDCIVRGMAYPYGTYNDEVIRVLHDCGIVYSRTVKATLSFDLPSEWLKWHPTCHHIDPHLPELTAKFVEKSPKVDQHPWLFYVWGHAYEFVRDDNWHIIENFADQISGKDDIWYATNMEIWEYTENFRHLVFSLDESRVYNPTAQTIYFTKGNMLYSVAPGQTIPITN